MREFHACLPKRHGGTSVDPVVQVRTIDRYRKRRPHLLLCIDGLNEADPTIVRAALSATATAELLRDGVGLVVTCWPLHWRRAFRTSAGAAAEVRLQDFTDAELAKALEMRGASFDEIPPRLHELARRPALLDQILRLKSKLGADATVTRMNVFWADLQYKAEQPGSKLRGMARPCVHILSNSCEITRISSTASQVASARSQKS